MGLTPDLFQPRTERRLLSPYRIAFGISRRLRRRLFAHDPKIRRSLGGLSRGLRLETNLRLDAHVLLGRYEKEISPFVRAFCPPGTVVFDVGANTGYYSLVTASLGAASVLAIEPDPRSRDTLQRVLAANPEVARVVTIAPEAAGATASDGVTTLDELAARPGGFVPDLIKIDVEGFEADVLDGSHRLLHERGPHVIVEAHSVELERHCLKRLKEAGYEPEIVNPRRWFGESRPLVLNRWIVARGRTTSA